MLFSKYHCKYNADYTGLWTQWNRTISFSRMLHLQSEKPYFPALSVAILLVQPIKRDVFLTGEVTFKLKLIDFAVVTSLSNPHYISNDILKNSIFSKWPPKVACLNCMPNHELKYYCKTLFSIRLITKQLGSLPITINNSRIWISWSIKK